MIQFDKIQYKNFLSVGDNGITIDLNTNRTTLMVGHNGAGKSLLLDALSFVLFGKPHRKINKAQLVNSINAKGCRVELLFSIGSKKYKVVRGIKPNIFEIWCDDVLLNQESHTRDYQKILESNILKLNHKSFHQVVVLGSSNFIPFMQLQQSHRREVIEDLLDISIFSKMNVLLKESQSKLKDDLRHVESRLEIIKEKLNIQNNHLDKLKSINESNGEKYDNEIQDLREQTDKYLSDNDVILKKYQDEYPKAEASLKKLNDTLLKLNKYESQILTNIKNLNQDVSFYSDNDSCPTCNQDIGSALKENKVNDCNHKLSSLNEGHTQLRDSLKETKEKIDEQQKTYNSLVQLNHQLTTNQTLIRNFEKRIVDLQKQKELTCSDDDIRDTTETIGKLRSERDSLAESKSLSIEERHYNEVLAELLKDTGIKTKVIKQYLPLMNRLINTYLQTLDFFVSFELNENFDETIRSRHRDDFSYASFSEGEKSRIDLSLLFAWRQIAKMKNSANTNLLILDEVFDGSLDGDGADNLFKIMNTLGEETRVFVITHKQDMTDNRFDRRIEFEKHKNFTRIKEVS
jgi:DNA repair exonuclease SbcCD ATPase subunit